MRVNGFWLVCDDGITRPVIPGAILANNEKWVSVKFLADSAADCTALSADLLPHLHQLPEESRIALAGIGGNAGSVVVQARIRFVRDNGEAIYITGPFPAFTDPNSVDTCVLGRDITNQFALIVDRPQDVVCLLGVGHRYTITAG